MPKETELFIEGLQIDDGYGEKDCDLAVTVAFHYTNSAKSDYYKGRWLDNVEIKSGTYFLIGNNGDNLGELEYNGKHDALVKQHAEKYWNEQE